MPKPRPVLCDMPWLIKQKVIGHTDNITRLVLRKTNKEFRQLVDHSPHPTRYDLIELIVEKRRVVLILLHENDQVFQVEYRKANFSKKMKGNLGSRIIIGNFDHLQKAVLELATVFAHRKASADVFRLVATGYVENSVKRSLKTFPKDKASFLNTFQQTFSQLPNLAKIGLLNIQWALTESEIMQIIPFLKPKYLETLEVEIIKDGVFENVLRTEQYQNLEEMTVMGGNLKPFLTAKICETTRIFGLGASTADLAALLEKLLQNTEELNEFELSDVTYNKRDFLNYLINFHQLHPQETNRHVMKMTNLDDYLVLRLRSDEITFTRVDQEWGLELLRNP